MFSSSLPQMTPSDIIFLISSLKYERIYESEAFDDKLDICPSLAAELSCPTDMDVSLRVSVQYSSSLTSGKEIILCSCTFFLGDVLAVFAKGGVFQADLTSAHDHVLGCKLHVELVKPLTQVLNEPSIALTAPRSKSNPLVQKYVFYNEEDNSTPVIDVEEYTWEPRLGMKVSLLYLEHILGMIVFSQKAWMERKQLEEMRQVRRINLCLQILDDLLS